MKRREFLHISSITGAGLLIGLPTTVASASPSAICRAASPRRWMTGSVRTGCASFQHLIAAIDPLADQPTIPVA